MQIQFQKGVVEEELQGFPSIAFAPTFLFSNIDDAFCVAVFVIQVDQRRNPDRFSRFLVDDDIALSGRRPQDEMARQDKVLHQLVQNYYGLRIIRIPDLFEALTWAIIGQQINLPFAYTLKKRFVEQFGEKLVYEGTVFWLYPAFDKIAAIDINELRSLQFTTRKAEYIIEVAKAMATGQVTKESLRHMNDRQHVQKTLLGIRGVGLWTADYVMMKCFADPAAFPVADVGLQNALKSRLGLQRKPTVDEIMDLGANWEGWQAYATFYLWRSLYEQAV